MPLNSGGYNLEDADDCNLIESSDLTNTPLAVDWLAMNGGNSLSHALLPCSAAIDSGDVDTCIAVDQRNVARPQGIQCDRGSYEATGEEETGPCPGEGDLTDDAEPTAVPTVTPVPLGPIDINFNADSYTVAPSEFTTVRRDVENAEIVLYEGVAMSALEAEHVCPEQTTAYQLTAQNGAETLEAFVTIEVVVEVFKDPNNLMVSDYVCTLTNFDVELHWNDRADNEECYRVYRDGSVVGTLDINANSFCEDPPRGGPYVYGVEAFNAGAPLGG